MESFEASPGLGEKLGPYTVIEPATGAGHYILAQDVVLKREVLLWPAAAASAGFSHPNLCPVLDSFEAGGRAWLATPAFEGRLLADMLAERPEARLTAAEARSLARGLASAIEARRGLEGAMRPESVWLLPNGRPLLLDFALEPAAGGTPQGGSFYALGALLYEGLAGEPPARPETRRAALEEGEADPLEAGFAAIAASPALLQAIRDLLKVAPGQPPKSAAALGALLAAESGPATEPTARPAASRELYEPSAPAATPLPSISSGEAAQISGRTLQAAELGLSVSVEELGELRGTFLRKLPPRYSVIFQKNDGSGKWLADSEALAGAMLILAAWPALFLSFFNISAPYGYMTSCFLAGAGLIWLQLRPTKPAAIGPLSLNLLALAAGLWGALDLLAYLGWLNIAALKLASYSAAALLLATALWFACRNLYLSSLLPLILSALCLYLSSFSDIFRQFAHIEVLLGGAGLFSLAVFGSRAQCAEIDGLVKRAVAKANGDLAEARAILARRGGSLFPPEMDPYGSLLRFVAAHSENKSLKNKIKIGLLVMGALFLVLALGLFLRPIFAKYAGQGSSGAEIIETKPLSTEPQRTAANENKALSTKPQRTAATADESARSLLQQLALAEVTLNTDPATTETYVDSSSLKNLDLLASFGFRPDRNVAFGVLKRGDSFVAAAAYAAAGSPVYIYDWEHLDTERQRSAFDAAYRRAAPEAAAALLETTLGAYSFEGGRMSQISGWHIVQDSAGAARLQPGPAQTASAPPQASSPPNMEAQATAEALISQEDLDGLYGGKSTPRQKALARNFFETPPRPGDLDWVSLALVAYAVDGPRTLAKLRTMPVDALKTMWRLLEREADGRFKEIYLDNFNPFVQDLAGERPYGRIMRGTLGEGRVGNGGCGDYDFQPEGGGAAMNIGICLGNPSATIDYRADPQENKVTVYCVASNGDPEECFVSRIEEASATPAEIFQRAAPPVTPNPNATNGPPAAGSVPAAPPAYNAADLQCETQPLALCRDKEGRGISGLVETFAEDGSLKTRAHYKDGLAHGPAASFYPGGGLNWLAVFRLGSREGLAVQFYEGPANGDNQIKWLVPFSGGRPHGLRRGFYENGRLKSETSYEDGKEQGALYEFHEDGSLKFEEKYEQGKKTGARREYAPGTKKRSPTPLDEEERTYAAELDLLRREFSDARRP